MEGGREGGKEGGREGVSEGGSRCITAYDMEWVYNREPKLSRVTM